MPPPLAEIVDVSALFSVIVASLAAGVGLAIGSSVAIFSATRAAELRRAGAKVGATALALVTIVAAAACLAMVAFGIYLLAS